MSNIEEIPENSIEYGIISVDRERVNKHLQRLGVKENYQTYFRYQENEPIPEGDLDAFLLFQVMITDNPWILHALGMRGRQMITIESRKQTFEEFKEAVADISTFAHFRKLYNIMSDMHKAAIRYEDAVVACDFNLRAGFFNPPNYHINAYHLQTRIENRAQKDKPKYYISPNTNNQILFDELNTSVDNIINNLMAFWDHVEQDFKLEIETAPYDSALFRTEANKGTITYRGGKKRPVILMQQGSEIEVGELLHEIVAWHYMTNGKVNDTPRNITDRKRFIPWPKNVFIEAILESRHLFRFR